MLPYNYENQPFLLLGLPWIMPSEVNYGWFVETMAMSLLGIEFFWLAWVTDRARYPWHNIAFLKHYPFRHLHKLWWKKIREQSHAEQLTMTIYLKDCPDRDGHKGGATVEQLKSLLICPWAWSILIPRPQPSQEYPVFGCWRTLAEHAA